MTDKLTERLIAGATVFAIVFLACIGFATVLRFILEGLMS